MKYRSANGVCTKLDHKPDIPPVIPFHAFIRSFAWYVSLVVRCYNEQWIRLLINLMWDLLLRSFYRFGNASPRRRRQFSSRLTAIKKLMHQKAADKWYSIFKLPKRWEPELWSHWGNIGLSRRTWPVRRGRRPRALFLFVAVRLIT